MLRRDPRLRPGRVHWLRSGLLGRARLALLGLRRPRLARAIRAVRSERLTYLQPDRLLELVDRVRELERRGLAGTIVEAGTAYGGSAVVLAAAKSPQRRLEVYDAFGAFPPPSERDPPYAHERHAEIAAGRATWSEDKPFYAYVEDLPAEVAAAFDRLGYPTQDNAVTLVPGLFEDTLHPQGPIALAHVDADWYDSVRVCLERIEPLLVVGGVIVFDDYDDWEGCRLAVDDFFNGKEDHYRFERRTRLHVVRVR